VRKGAFTDFCASLNLSRRLTLTAGIWFFTRRFGLRSRSSKQFDNAVWFYGEWSGTVQGDIGLAFVKGYFSAIYVRDGNDWKIRALTLTDHPRTATPAETK
jgi:hypothetical protein